MTSALSWQNSISLFPASFHIPRPNLPVTPGVSWLPTFAFQSPIMKRTTFLVLVLKGLVGFHKTIQLQLLQHYWLGHRLGLPWYWMVCLGNEQRSFCHFWNCIQVLHFGPLVRRPQPPALQSKKGLVKWPALTSLMKYRPSLLSQCHSQNVEYVFGFFLYSCAKHCLSN